MSTTEIVGWILGLSLFAFVFLPVLAYVCCKMGRLGYLEGEKMFDTTNKGNEDVHERS